METRRVRAGSVELAVIEAGPPDGRPLLLVHGWPAAKEDFADHLDALGALGWHAMAPDLRGHGSSDKPEDQAAYTLRTLAGDLLGLADALGWDRFTLLGHSMGGMVAQHAALAAPHRLDALVLMDTSHGPLADIPRDLIDLAKQVITEGGMQLYLEVSKTIDGPLDTPAYKRLKEERPEYEAYGDRKTLDASPHMCLALIDEMVAPDDRLEALAGLDVPTLVVVGEMDDHFVPHAERMAGAMPNARLVVIPDAGHSAQFENPAAWFAALSQFLSEVGARRGLQTG